MKTSHYTIIGARSDCHAFRGVNRSRPSRTFVSRQQVFSVFTGANRDRSLGGDVAAGIRARVRRCSRLSRVTQCTPIIIAAANSPTLTVCREIIASPRWSARVTARDRNTDRTAGTVVYVLSSTTEILRPRKGLRSEGPRS